MITRQVLAEGVKRVVVVTDEPEKYPANVGLRARRRRSTIATTSTRSSARCARSQGATVIVYDQTCAAEKRRRRKRGTFPDPAEARRHQRAGVRGLRRLQREVQLPLGRAGGNRVRPQARHRPVLVQQGLLVREGLLPELRHGRGRAAAQAQGGRAGSHRRRCRNRRYRRSTVRTASSSPAWAARVSSPSARCSAWPRTSKARARRCST